MQLKAIRQRPAIECIRSQSIIEWSERTHRKDLGSNMLNMADREALFRIRRASYQCIILNVFVSNVLILALPSYGNCYI